MVKRKVTSGGLKEAVFVAGINFDSMAFDLNKANAKFADAQLTLTDLGIMVSNVVTDKNSGKKTLVKGLIPLSNIKAVDFVEVDD